MDISSYESIASWVLERRDVALPLVGLMAAAESVFMVGLFFPGTVTMTAVGALVGAKALPLTDTLLWAVLGAVLGDALSFALGNLGKKRILSHPWIRRQEALIVAGERFFTRHGAKSIFFSRFVGPLRPVVPTVAAFMGVSWKTFMVMNLLSAMLWAPLYMSAGVLLGMMAERLGKGYAEAIMLAVGVVLPAIAIAFAFRREIGQAARHFSAKGNRKKEEAKKP